MVEYDASMQEVFRTYMEALATYQEENNELKNQLSDALDNRKAAPG